MSKNKFTSKEIARLMRQNSKSAKPSANFSKSLKAQLKAEIQPQGSFFNSLFGSPFVYGGMTAALVVALVVLTPIAIDRVGDDRGGMVALENVEDAPSIIKSRTRSSLGRGEIDENSGLPDPVLDSFSATDSFIDDFGLGGGGNEMSGGGDMDERGGGSRYEPTPGDIGGREEEPITDVGGAPDFDSSISAIQDGIGGCMECGGGMTEEYAPMEQKGGAPQPIPDSYFQRGMGGGGENVESMMRGKSQYESYGYIKLDDTWVNFVYPDLYTWNAQGDGVEQVGAGYKVVRQNDNYFSIINTQKSAFIEVFSKKDFPKRSKDGFNEFFTVNLQGQEYEVWLSYPKGNKTTISELHAIVKSMY